MSRQVAIFCLVGVLCFVIGILVGMVMMSSNIMSSTTTKSSSTDGASSQSSSKRRRNAFVGYMDRVANSAAELRWMYFSAFGSNVVGDIILMGHPAVPQIVPHFCSILRGDQASAAAARRALDSQMCAVDPRNDNFAFLNANANANTTTTRRNTTYEKHPCPVRCVVIIDKADDPDAVRLNYPFLRSLYFPHHAAISELLVNDYEYVLKTDLDVFFTPHFMHNLKPPRGRIYAGEGKYVWYAEVREKLKRIAKDMRLKHRGIHNVGATMYGESKLILDITKLARRATIHILEREYKTGPGKWAGWWRGVSSMYGGELAVNHMAPNYLRGQLDMPCTNHFKACAGSVIHAWHGNEVFSKFDVEKYNVTDTLLKGGAFPRDPRWLSRAGNFAMYVALASKSKTRPDAPWGRAICV